MEVKTCGMTVTGPARTPHTQRVCLWPAGLPCLPLICPGTPANPGAQAHPPM